jgi:hypothetical protein
VDNVVSGTIRGQHDGDRAEITVSDSTTGSGITVHIQEWFGRGSSVQARIDLDDKDVARLVELLAGIAS